MNIAADLAIPRDLVRMPVWTFTLLNTYRKICPHQAAERYIYKRVPYVETDAMAFGNRVHKAMELRVGRGVKLPDDLPYEHVSSALVGRGAKVEQRLGVSKEGRSVDFFANNVWGRGKLDYHVVNGERAQLIDYKTGKMREDPFELKVQAVLLHARHPELKEIKGRYIWLKDNKLGESHDLSDTAATWNEIGRLVRLIERDMAAGVFEKREGPLCHWCDVRDCENNPNYENTRRT